MGWWKLNHESHFSLGTLGVGNETRSWPTSYRGDLVICAAKHEMEFIDWKLVDLFGVDVSTWQPGYGNALCVVTLDDVVETIYFHGPTPNPINQKEALLGDYSIGRFAWRTTNLRKLKTPVPIRGHQGLWHLTPEETILVSEQLP